MPLLSCKVLSRQAEDPSADITQAFDIVDTTNEQNDGGVKCLKAHAILIQFATLEEKLEVVSQALEYDYIRKSGGGCKVRNEVI